MKKLSILRQKLIQETKQLIDEDVIDIRSVDHDFQSVTDSQSKKENLQTVQSDFSSKQNQVENGDSQTTARQKLVKNSVSGQYGNQFKKREGEDNLLSLQKTNLRKHKADIKVTQEQVKNQSQSQLNFHNTLLDIQKEYLDYEMKKAQNEYAIDLDLIQEDFANQQQKQQPQLDLQKKKKSEFIDLLKKCKICSESDLHYASKPFKLMKKLKDIRIMFERKSNNLEQQMKKSNMNKNKIIEDIKADKVIIRKALPEMAKNYLSEIQQQKRINKLLQEKNIQKAKKQLASINQNQSGFSMLNNNNQISDQNLKLHLQYIDSQDPSVYVNPTQDLMQSQTTKNYYKNNSTSPFRKNFSNNFNKEAKTSRNNQIEISSFNDYVQTNDSKSLSRFGHLEQKRKPNQQPKLSGKYNSSDKNGISVPCIAEYGNYFSQENSPYIRQLDSRQKSAANKVISSNFNEIQKRKANSISIQQQQQQNNQNDSSINIDTVTIPSSFQNQIASVSTMNPIQSKQSLSSFTTLHLQQNIPEQKRTSKVNQLDLNSINSLANLPQTTDRLSHVSFQHRHSNSEINNGSQLSMEKIQYQIFLSNLKDNQQNSNTDRIQQYLKNQKQIDQFQQQSPQKFSVSSTHNKSLSSLSTTFKTTAPPGSSSGAMQTDRQNLRNDQISVQSPSAALMLSNLNQAQINNFDTPSQLQKYSSNTSFAFRSDKKYNSNNTTSQQSRLYAKQSELNKKQKSKEGILENVYKFDEDKYFQHQQIYKYEIEQAQILAIKRNQTTRSTAQQQNQKESENIQDKSKKNEGYFHDEYSSNDDSIPSATEAQLDNFYEESKKIQKRVLKLKKGDLHTKIKSLLRIENINNEINKLVHWKMKK
ncbi:hypothetical protein ABPG74_008040 [Tetrahymena malaccensis]